MPTVKLDGKEYDYFPQSSVAASKIVVDMYNMLGKPTDPFSTQGKKMVNILIAVWEDLYPQQARAWYAQQKEYKEIELSNREKVSKKTGRSLASVPTPIYKMMKKLFPDFKMDSRDDFMKLTKHFKVFQTTADR